MRSGISAPVGQRDEGVSAGHAILIHLDRNCLLRVVAAGQSDSSESSHRTPAVGKLPTPSMSMN